MKRLTICLLSVLFTVAVSPICLATTIYGNSIAKPFSNGDPGTNEISDDLQRVSGHDMVSFQFGVSARFETRVTICFSTSDAAESIWPDNGSVLVHTEVTRSAANSCGLVTVPLGSMAALPTNTWMSVHFDDGSAQDPFFNSPTIDSSHDLVGFAGGRQANLFGARLNNLKVGLAVPKASALAVATFGSVSLVDGD